jgi:predicted CXXCH cytochrome family protein
VRKTLFVTAACLILAFATSGLVVADGGPHGGYTATTDGCAGCHRAHTAIGPRLLVEASTYDLCMSCHGSGGLGANTNVDDGIYLSSRDDPPGGANGNVGAGNTPDNAPLLGGGFVTYQGLGVTSVHDVDPTAATDLAWGNSVDRGLTAGLVVGPLSCASCHDPHGSDNYRILRAQVNGVAVSVAQVDEGAAKDYDTEQWGAGMSAFCGACHAAYHETGADVGHDLTNQTFGGGFTHRVDMPWNGDGLTDPVIGVGGTNPEGGWAGYTLPLAQTGSGDLVVCSTCHLSHGTSAQMIGFADPAFDPSGPQGPIPAGDSSLLRLDNRGVCEVCHQK